MCGSVAILYQRGRLRTGLLRQGGGARDRRGSQAAIGEKILQRSLCAGITP
jgi:hypothetical protein